MKTTIKEQFEDLLKPKSQEHADKRDAHIIALQFLGIIDRELSNSGISKKEFAEKVGTSASYITQLMMADKLPNLKILAKMQRILGIKFSILDEVLLHEKINKELNDFKKTWASSVNYEVENIELDIYVNINDELQAEGIAA